jgi:hypothetical protein
MRRYMRRAADERSLFDMAAIRWFVVEERKSARIE